jgi:hypothetical protein
MKKIRWGLVSIVVIILAAANIPAENTYAQDKAGSAVYILDIQQVIKKPKNILLSDIAKSVTYIPLETTPKFLIGDKSVRVKPCGDYIFVSEHGKPVGVFSRTGKFIRTIGRIGNGPGEYNFDFLFWPDSTTREIYVWNAVQSSLMAFSFDGKYQGDIKPGPKPGAFAPLGHNLFATWTFRQEEYQGRYFRLFTHDRTGRIIDRFYEPKRELNIRMGIMMPEFTPTMGGYLYNTWEDEFISRITISGKFVKALVWDLGKLKMPSAGMEDFQRYKREKANYVLDVSASESETAWYIKFYYKDQLRMAVHDKITGGEFMVANPDTAQKGVFNDIDDGPSFWPYWDNEGGRNFVKLIDAVDILENVKKTRPGGVAAKFPQKSAAWKKLVAGLSENSNPVVMVVEMQ